MCISKLSMKSFVLVYDYVCVHVSQGLEFYISQVTDQDYIHIIMDTDTSPCACITLNGLLVS